MPVSPAFMQAVESGAQLGTRLRQQQAQEQQAANALRLSFAEQALRQQAHQQAAQLAAQKQQDDQAYQQASLALKRQAGGESDDIKRLLEEGRNTRAADSLEAHGQRTQDWIDSRIKLAGESNALKAKAEEGKNIRAEDRNDLLQSLGTDANEIKLLVEEGKNARFWATRDDREKALASKLPEADKIAYAAELKAASAGSKLDPTHARFSVQMVNDKWANGLNAAAQLRQQQPPPAQVMPNGTPSGISLKRTPKPAAIEHLKANPDTADAFDEWYGAGQAEMVLGR